MIKKEFCDYLEYEVCKYLKCSNDKIANKFWCDGVMPSMSSLYYSKEYVKTQKEIILKAFVGIDGQTEYDLILKLGIVALDKYLLDENIEACFYDYSQIGVFNINVERKRIEIQLK